MPFMILFILKDCRPKCMRKINEYLRENLLLPYWFRIFAYSKTSSCNCGPDGFDMGTGQPATAHRTARNCRTKFWNKYKNIYPKPKAQKRQTICTFLCLVLAFNHL